VDSSARLRNCERALRKLLAEESSLFQFFRNLPVVLDQLHTYLDMTALVMHACEALHISARLPPSILVNHFDGEQRRCGAILAFLARVSRIASSAKNDSLLLTTDELDCVRQCTELLYGTSEAVIRVRRDSLYGEEVAGLLAGAEKTTAELLDR